MDFGVRLRELLELRNISQKELASAIKISPSTVGNYICGLRKPDYITLKAIASYFRVSVDFLLDMDAGYTTDEGEAKLVQIYRILSDPQRELLLDQAMLLIKRKF